MSKTTKRAFCTPWACWCSLRCHVAPICRPELFFILRLSATCEAQSILFFVRRVVLLSLGAHRTGAGAALSMLAISALMVLWILLRSIKFSIDNMDAERLLWYFYYFPMLFIPMLSVFNFPARWAGGGISVCRDGQKLLYLPTLLLLLLVPDQ